MRSFYFGITIENTPQMFCGGLVVRVCIEPPGLLMDISATPLDKEGFGIAENHQFLCAVLRFVIVLHTDLIFSELSSPYVHTRT